MKSITHRAKQSLRLKNVLLAALFSCLAATGITAYAKETKDPTDVTAAVAAAVKDESLSINASNELFGDTANGVSKKLTIEYRFGDEKHTSEANEGGKIQIAAPAGKKLVITKAIYGPADGSKPVNAGAITEDPGMVLDTLPGFKVEHLLRANGAKNGSWICMAKDPKGRLLLGGQSGQPITRVTLKNGAVEKEELLHIPVTETMGMLYVGNVLYINGNGNKGFALYRCKDTKGDDSYDDVEFLRTWPGEIGRAHV